MKTFIFILLISSTHLFSQKLLTPANSSIDQSLIKDETTESVWYAENAGAKVEIGHIITELKNVNTTDLLIKTTVKMKQMPDANWVDSTLVKTANFQPIRHSSFNAKRDIVLQFNKNYVTGYHFDKKTGKRNQINMAATDYFDSSSYPMVIRFSPLKKNYLPELVIFDYNSDIKKGKQKAYIKDVQETEFDGRKVWAVKTTDDITDLEATVTYFIDVETRKILKQDMQLGERKMTMEMVK
ncbi:hypothetical protein EG347_10975 [Chryseobacterium sp. G0186]|uniref:DUF3108 domain-containing protein n=1 Tax=Chryseobacterium sp. G0186 TaxID=2487064 RepID=UPI000F4E0320|nr:hypothetical protein [Chryseobacterium sp. G0186]AZA78003.1 hypothetical protein EG347_10975 [Chryseobacterium sp. G0186]